MNQECSIESHRAKQPVNEHSHAQRVYAVTYGESRPPVGLEGPSVTHRPSPVLYSNVPNPAPIDSPSIRVPPTCPASPVVRNMNSL